MNEQQQQQQTSQSSGIVRRAIALLLFAAIALMCLHTTAPVFVVTGELANLPVQPSPEQHEQLTAELNRLDKMNSVLIFSYIAGLLSLGMIFGSSLRNAGIIKIALGVILSVSMGALAGYVGQLQVHYWTSRFPMIELQYLLTTHASTGAILGLGLGILHWCVSKEAPAKVTSLVGALVSGAFAGTIYTIGVSTTLPSAKVELLMPEAMVPRIAWFAIMVTMIALGIYWVPQLTVSPSGKTEGEAVPPLETTSAS